MSTSFLDIPDDSGFLALVDPDAYRSFVGEDWTFEQLMAHFTAQMRERRMLIWRSGAENLWRVQVRLSTSAINGYRELTGPLTITNGRLLLTNYERLTMAAQFEDVALPEPENMDMLIPVPSGHYRCRIVQIDDPENEQDDPENEQFTTISTGVPDFVIELAPSEEELAVWTAIP